MDAVLQALSERIGRTLLAREQTLAAAESCTGGWVAETVTATAGSSQWFERGFVTYTNVAKSEMLGVSMHSLVTHGAVSEEVVGEMVVGALTHSHATVALAISGVAGPGGGSSGKPVGTVCFAWCSAGEVPQTETKHFSGDREAVRRQSVIHALEGLLSRLDSAD